MKETKKETRFRNVDAVRVLIVTLPRSGCHYLSKLLESNRIAMMDEIPFNKNDETPKDEFEKILAKFFEKFRNSSAASCILHPHMLRGDCAAIWRTVRERANPTKIVHLRRDPLERAVSDCFANFQQSWNNHETAIAKGAPEYDAQRIDNYYKLSLKWGEHNRRLLSIAGDHFSIDYAHLCFQTSVVMRDLCAWLGVPFVSVWANIKIMPQRDIKESYIERFRSELKYGQRLGKFVKL